MCFASLHSLAGVAGRFSRNFWWNCELKQRDIKGRRVRARSRREDLGDLIEMGAEKKRKL